MPLLQRRGEAGLRHGEERIGVPDAAVAGDRQREGAATDAEADRVHQRDLQADGPAQDQQRHEGGVHDVGARDEGLDAGDLAAAALSCLRADPPVQGRYDLPGGETLSYGEMLRRTLAVAVPRARLVPVPGPIFRTALRAARAFGLGGAGEGLLARFDRDLVYDAGPAHRDLGYSPRPFRPEADMFPG